MKNIKVYGNEQCPDCSALKKELSDKEIKFEFINIIESLENLKKFLHFRDNYEDIFNDCKLNVKLVIHLIVLEIDNKIKLFTKNTKEDFLNQL